MQLMWLSGPTAKVVTLSLSRRTIVAMVLGLAALLVALGGGLQWLGLRIAVDADPAVARLLGGVTSTTEQARIAGQYEAQIAALHERMARLGSQVAQLESTKRAIVQLVPVPEAPRWSPTGGQGGPWRGLFDLDWFAPKAADGLVRLNDEADRLDQHMRRLQAAWVSELDLVQALPLQPPLKGEFQQTSDFGTRFDPFNRGLSRHEGVDFVAPYGTPIHATAGGVVVLAEASGPYGLTVEIDHGRGFSTRYAHASRLEVSRGQTVVAGQPIARLGNTGRSTGPHLHYEVRLHGQPIRPLADQVLKAAAAQAKAAAPAAHGG